MGAALFVQGAIGPLGELVSNIHFSSRWKYFGLGVKSIAFFNLLFTMVVITFPFPNICMSSP